MSWHLSRGVYLSQVIVQRATLASILSLAAAGALWSLAAAVGFAPWLQMDVGLGGAVSVDAGFAVQLALTLLLLGLCFFIPMNDRVMRLENSHRTFRVTMWDVAQAYQAAHAADRDGCFSLKSEFDSVRERLEHLRSHPDLGKLEPEVLEMAAQMSYESRELAEIYSTECVERARQFLRHRQEEADLMMASVRPPPPSASSRAGLNRSRSRRIVPAPSSRTSRRSWSHSSTLSTSGRSERRVPTSRSSASEPSQRNRPCGRCPRIATGHELRPTMSCPPSSPRSTPAPPRAPARRPAPDRAASAA